GRGTGIGCGPGDVGERAVDDVGNGGENGADGRVTEEPADDGQGADGVAEQSVGDARDGLGDRGDGRAVGDGADELAHEGQLAQLGEGCRDGLDDVGDGRGDPAEQGSDEAAAVV